MRKRLFTAVFLILISIIAFVSCNDSVSSTAEIEKGSITSLLQKDYGTRESLTNTLLLYLKYNDYERTESSIKTDIISYLDTFHQSGNATKAVTDSRTVETILMESFPVTEDGSIRLEVYDIIEKNPDRQCFIIIPNDKRIADFLYLSDGGSWETAKEVEIIREMLKSMLLYSRDVIELSNSLEQTQAGTKSIVIGSHKTVEDNIYKYIPTLNWEQRNSFNDAIQYYHGNYPVGCGAVGLGIIMAQWKQPAKFIDIDFTGDDERARLSVLKIRWPVMSSWDGYYNWDGILAATQPEYIRQRAAFLLDVADACSSVYKPEATGTYHEYYAVCLNHFGYTYDYYRNAVDNNTTIFALVDSVENGMPVLVSGYSGKEGHTFVVDGVDMTTSVRKWYSIDEDSFSSEDVTSIQSLKYHANLGWNGDQNGWYSPDAVTVKYKFPCEFIYLNIHPVK